MKTLRREVVRGSAGEYAAILTKALPPETIAVLLTVLVTAIDDPDCFTDREATIAERLFDRLREKCPEAVALIFGENEEN